MTASFTRSSPSPESLGLAVALLLCGVILVLVFPYCWLKADDFCRAAGAEDRGVVASVVKEYFVWTGRWLGIGIEYAVLAAPHRLLAYRMTLAAIALLYLIAVYYLCSTLFPTLERGKSWMCAGVLFALYWAALPETRDSIYWLCGSVEYQLSISLAIFSFATMVRLTLRAYSTGKQVALLLFASLCAFAVTGIHELFGLMISLVMIAASMFSWSIRSPKRLAWNWLAVISIAGFFVAYFAPGNSVRISGQENYGDPKRAIVGAFYSSTSMLPDWIFDVRLLLATAFFVVLIKRNKLTADWLTRSVRSQLLRIVPLVWLVLLAGSFGGPAWGTGGVVASRALAAAYMIFLLGWFLFWFLLVEPEPTQDPKWCETADSLRKLLTWALAASLLLTGTTRRAAKELVFVLPQLQAAQHERESLLKATAGNPTADVVIPRLRPHSSIVGFANITPDAKNWINRCAAAFYGVRSIRVE